MLDSAELGPFAWMVSPSCETELTIAPIVCWKWERVDQTTKGKHVFRAFLGCGVPTPDASSLSYCLPRPSPGPIHERPCHLRWSRCVPLNRTILKSHAFPPFQIPGPGSGRVYVLSWVSTRYCKGHRTTFGSHISFRDR